MKYPLRIHGTGIFTYIWVIFKWLNVGKYTSPMDPWWGIPYLSTPHPVTLGASILRATPDPKYTGLSYTNEIHKEICKPFQPNPNKYVASWWLNQPLWNICSSKLDHFPNFRGENKKSLKPPPRSPFFNMRFFLLLGFNKSNGCIDVGVSKNRGTPRWMVKIMENPFFLWMIWGENPLFLETSMYSCHHKLWTDVTHFQSPVSFLQARAQINGLSNVETFLRWPYPPVN